MTILNALISLPVAGTIGVHFSRMAATHADLTVPNLSDCLCLHFIFLNLKDLVMAFWANLPGLPASQNAS